MERLTMHTTDEANANRARIAELFPECVTETKDENGELILAVDFDKLKAELGTVVQGKEERYLFTWPGKRDAINQANSAIAATLRPVRDDSEEFDKTKNIYIEGDNLDVLKLLRETYLGKVKVIYIDPPYNTGKDFVYKDNLNRDLKDYLANSGQFDEQGNRLVATTESNGRYHTDWLNMIYPRLRVAKSLLSDDGVIFISIDDHEESTLKNICDEIFGGQNFIGILILKTATDNNPSQINIEHEYMLCYAKNRIKQSNWTRTSEAALKIVEQYQVLKNQGLDIASIQKQLRAWIKQHKDELPQVAHYNNVDEKGVYSSSSNSSNPHPGGYMFDIVHPVTGGICPKPDNGWRWPESTFWEYDKNGEIEWGKDHTTQPHVKKRIETCVEYLRTLIYEDNRATTKMLSDLFDGKKVFDNPKPVTVLSRILDFVTKDDDLILDFFSGSASTAHAVMQLNAMDGGHRQFIMVQVPELTYTSKTEEYVDDNGKTQKRYVIDEKTGYPVIAKDSEARKAGYHYITEIGEERIRRAGKLIKQEHPEAKDLDTGFRVLRLDSSNMNDVYYSSFKFSQSVLPGLIDNVKPDRTDEDLLFQVMLELNIPLSASIEPLEIAGKRVFSVANGHLYATFDNDVNETTVTEIAKKYPNFFVMRDASAANDNVLDNFEQIFKHYSPDTTCKIL